MTSKFISTRLWSKLVEAIHGSIFVDTPETTRGALLAIQIGLQEDARRGAAYPDDDRFTHALATVWPFLEATAEDERASAGAPPLVARARRLSSDEKRTLGVAVWDLWNALNDAK